MPLSLPPSKSPSVGRREKLGRAWFIAITVVLSICVAANMAIIFHLSQEAPEDSSNRSDAVTDTVVDIVYPDIQQRPAEEQKSLLSSLHNFIRKLAHFAEFALLGFLSTLLVRHISPRLPAFRLWMQIAALAVFSLLYAISDEVHQIFTDRGPAVMDVLIDFAGAVFGILLGLAFVWLVRLAFRSVAKRKRVKEAAV